MKYTYNIIPPSPPHKTNATFLLELLHLAHSYTGDCRVRERCGQGEQTTEAAPQARDGTEESRAQEAEQGLLYTRQIHAIIIFLVSIKRTTNYHVL